MLSKFFSSLVVSLPSSWTLSLFWNFGSMLGMVLIFQIFTGVLLALKYTPHMSFAFLSIVNLMVESEGGFMLRIFHFNGASLFFMFVYLHFFKGLFFFSYRLSLVWLSGVTILLMLMMTAFLGYVLPWAQMSFWACTVITNLISVIPYLGLSIVYWVWGGYSVGNDTLGLFYILHFILPFIILMLVVVHLLMLHASGSTSTLYCVGSDFDKVSFSPYYLVKDLINILFWLIFFIFVLYFPFTLGDAEMFIEANPLLSPVSIVPEWYFLFAYAILRSIPNKMLGVLALAMSVVSFYFLSLSQSFISPFSKSNKSLVFTFIFIFLILTWIGQCHVESPFIFIGGLFSFLYFFLLMLIFFNMLVSRIFYYLGYFKME